MKPLFTKKLIGVSIDKRTILLIDRGLYTENSKEDGIYTIPYSGGCKYIAIYKDIRFEYLMGGGEYIYG